MTEAPPFAPWHRALRTWVTVHCGLMLLTVPLILLWGLYGLSNKATDAVSFTAALLGGVGLLIALPLTLLKTRSDPSWRLLQGLGLLSLAAGTVGVLSLLGLWLLQSAWMDLRVRYELGDLRIHSAQATPVLLQGQKAGLRVVLELDVPAPVRLETMGRGAVELMQNLELEGPFFGLKVGEGRVTLNGTPWAELPGLALAVGPTWHWDTKIATLPAGRYRVEKVVWLQGLRHEGDGAGPDLEPNCVPRGQSTAQMQAQWAPFEGHPLKVKLNARYDYTWQRGHHIYSLQAPLDLPFHAAEWVPALGLLPCC